MQRSDAIERLISSLVPSLITLKFDTLAIPALISASSALLLFLHFISTRKKVEDEEHQSPTDNVSQAFVTKLRQHADRYGGLTIFIWRVLRLLAVLDLVGLAVAALILTKEVVSDYTHSARILSWSVLGSYVGIS